MEEKINASQEEMRHEISAFQDKINVGQSEFEERIMCTLEAQLNGATTWLKQQAQKLWDETWNLHEDFNKQLQVTWDKFSHKMQGTWNTPPSSRCKMYVTWQ